MNNFISDERCKVLEEYIEEARGHLKEPNFFNTLKYLQESGRKFTTNDIIYLQEKIPDQFSIFQVPVPLVQFIVLLEEQKQSERLLDTCGKFGLFGAYLAQNLPEKEIEVISFVDSKHIVVPEIIKNLTIKTGITITNTDKLSKKYDTIISVFPIRFSKTTLDYSYNTTSLYNDPILIIIKTLNTFLSGNGRFIFAVSPLFCWKNNPQSINKHLNKLGFNLSAMLLARRSLVDKKGVDSTIIIIDRVKQENLFVAEIPLDIAAQRSLIERLNKKQEGIIPSHGRIVPLSQYYSLELIEKRERYDKLAKSKGFQPISFNMAVTKICTPKRRGKEFERCEEHPKAVYLPEMHVTRATTHQDDLSPKLKSYLQLIVNPNIVSPHYLAEYLNSHIGLTYRETLMTGDIIPKINRRLLKESNIYLPPFEKLQQVIEVTNEIQRMRSSLSELESKLWEDPGEAKNILKAIHNIKPEERFLDWVETLPFPLASILRSYQTHDQQDKDKYERLLHFFEAFTKFSVAIHLSAFRASNSYWEFQQKRIMEFLRKAHLSFERPPLGLWKVMNELMTNRLFEMLSGKKERAVAQELYVTNDIRFLEILASKELCNILDRAKEYRNLWVGHGGAVSESKASDRHEKLVQELADFRKIFGNSFLHYRLIESETAEILEGPVFRCRIKYIMGSNPSFENDTVDFVSGPTSKTLYLYNPGNDRALKLMPLVQMHETPQPASYFYNCMEKNLPQLVTYHLVAQSEKMDDNPELLSFLEEFSDKEKNK